MAHRHRGAAAAHGGGGHDGSGSMRWLLTYADLITLLMVFFVVLYAMAKVDADRYAEVADSLRRSFGGSSAVGQGVSLPGSGAMAPAPVVPTAPLAPAVVEPGREPADGALGEPAVTPATPATAALDDWMVAAGAADPAAAPPAAATETAIASPPPAPVSTPSAAAEATPPASPPTPPLPPAEGPAAIAPSPSAANPPAPTHLPATNAVDARLSAAAAALSRLPGPPGAISVQLNNQGLVLEFLVSLLFESGQAALRPEATILLDPLSSTLRDLPYSIMVHGTGADGPGGSANWTLASQRSVSVIDYLTSQGRVPPDRLLAVGYGGRSAGQRVAVVVVRPSGGSSPVVSVPPAAE